MRIAIRNSYEPLVFPDVDAAVFCDVFRASTTLLALIEQRPERILSANDLDTVRRYQGQGYDLFSEVFDGGYDNSPAQVMAGDFSGRLVIHKSTNLTNAIFHHPGARRSLIGGFVNAARLTQWIREQGFATVELVAAGHFARGTEALEDTACVRFLAELLAGKTPAGVPGLAEIQAKLADKRSRRPDMAAHYWDDTELALRLDSLPSLAEVRRLDGTTMEVLAVTG